MVLYPIKDVPSGPPCVWSSSTPKPQAQAHTLPFHPPSHTISQSILLGQLPWYSEKECCTEEILTSVYHKPLSPLSFSAPSRPAVTSATHSSSSGWADLQPGLS